MSGASREATVRNTTSAVGERQILPRQTKRILTARLFYAVAPPGEAGAERAPVLRRLLRHCGRLLLLLRAHLHFVLLCTLGVRGASDHRAGEATEHCAGAPIPARRYGSTEDGARDRPDCGAGTRRGTARDHSVLRWNIGRAGIEAGLLHRPQAAIVAIPALLVGRLAVLGIGVNRGVRRRPGIARRRRGRRPRRRSRRAAREAQKEGRQRGDPGDAPEG